MVRRRKDGLAVSDGLVSTKNDELSRYAVEEYPLRARLLTGAVLGSLGAQTNLLLVEIFKMAQSRIFDELSQILEGHGRQEERDLRDLGQPPLKLHGRCPAGVDMKRDRSGEPRLT